MKKRSKKLPAISLSADDRLAMFRCAIYTKMGIVNEEQKPTDRQCIEWLQRVCCQAEHRNDPPLKMLAYEPVKVETPWKSVPELEIRRFFAVVELPEWRDLPA
jgi:hypothetical protein